MKNAKFALKMQNVVYQIFISCFKELSRGEIFYVFEDEMKNYTDKDIEKNILDKISAFMGEEKAKK